MAGTEWLDSLSNNKAGLVPQFLNSSSSLANTALANAQTANTAQEMDAKRMANQATKSALNYSNDPFTQVAITHPAEALGLAQAMQANNKTAFLKMAINQASQKLAQATNGGNNSSDLVQQNKSQDLVDNVLPQQSSDNSSGLEPVPVNQPIDQTDTNDKSGATPQEAGVSPIANTPEKTPEESPTAQRKDILSDVKSDVDKAQQKAIDATNEAKNAKGQEALGLPYVDKEGNLSSSEALEKVAENHRLIAQQKVDLAKTTIENDPQQLKLKSDITSDGQILPGLRTASVAASNSIDNWKEVKDIVTKNGINAGSLNPLKEKLGAALSSAGIDPDKVGLTSATNLNQINKIMSTSIFDGIKSALQGQRITNSEFSTYKTTLPNIDENTTAGFTKLLDMATAVKQRDIDYSKMANQWAAKYGATGQLNEKGQSLDESWNKYMKDHPLTKILADNNANANSNPDFKDAGFMEFLRKKGAKLP